MIPTPAQLIEGASFAYELWKESHRTPLNMQCPPRAGDCAFRFMYFADSCVVTLTSLVILR
jgi:hypothetical protein